MNLLTYVSQFTYTTVHEVDAYLDCGCAITYADPLFNVSGWKGVQKFPEQEKKNIDIADEAFGQIIQEGWRVGERKVSKKVSALYFSVLKGAFQNIFSVF